MAFQLSVAARDGELDAIQTAGGTSPLLEFYTGSEPANCAAAATGTLLVSFALPSSWMASASTGTKLKSGTWSGTITAAGTAGYFRIYDSGHVTCHLQGTVTITGGGGDMTLDNNVLGVGQVLTINTFTMTSGNA